MNEPYIDSLRKRYDSLVTQFGRDPKGAQWSNSSSQEQRFEILTTGIDLNKKSILDIGCGTGQLLSFLLSRGIKDISYTGLDLSNAAINLAKETYPEHIWICTDFLNEFDSQKRTYDVVILSGIFNNKTNDSWQYFESLIRKAKDCFSDYLAFNLMSKYVDYEDPTLNYFYPEEVFAFLKKNISARLVLRNDYVFDQSKPPFEFSVYLYK